MTIFVALLNWPIHHTGQNGKNGHYTVHTCVKNSFFDNTFRSFGYLGSWVYEINEKNNFFISDFLDTPQIR